MDKIEERKQKRRDKIARALESPLFRQRKIKSKKEYNRKKEKQNGIRKAKI